ncbi:MAG: PAS domain S-box protein [Betaproteobacteria bacterium]|nr:MAG: PAS domain S-box protein [Betaproteobacteria bacterium]
MEVPRLVRINYRVRTAAFFYTFFVLALQLWERHAPLVAWAFLALQFLVYPHLVYWRALRSQQPTRAELDNLLIDSTLFGAWSAYLGFPTWLTYTLLGSTMLNATVNRGLPGTLLALACSSAGAALWIAIGGFHYWPGTSDLVSALAFFGILGYTCAVGYVVYRQNRRILRGRDELRASEERYRLITENAADLIAMVDQDGRWLYTSPSYARILDPADLQAGADAFRHVHPDDADRARVSVLRVAGTGKARELPLRLVDREGRVRQYRMRVQPVENGRAPRDRLLLVSQDVTDLRESEEKLLLAAQAFEGMTQAIMITGADGTVQTVNRAFTEITGYEREDVVGQPEKAVRHALQPAEFYDNIYATVRREGHWSGSFWSKRKSGAVYREWRSVRAVRDAEGATTHYVIVFSEAGGGTNGAHPELGQQRG